ncbi:MAG: DNA ligase D [Betaproteobacteria bacterium]|nr:DNA ligase D [Betaproteobacteria bacterium]
MAGLNTYRAKRRFGVTAEPKGTRGRRSGHAFVIQKHAARRLHYDLRLELDGVMKSWAVTRGPSLVAGDKRLAVQVEDHPIDYNKFEGTIPAGEYGGGTVMNWDRGSWQPEHDPHQGLRKGHLSFELHGEKLHGGWHLVRMRRRPSEKRDNWLLIKQDDDAARGAHDKDILEQKPRSVKSGRSMDEIAKGTLKKTAKKPATKKKVKHKHGRAAAATLVRRTQKPRPANADKAALKRARDAAPPAFVDPCLATLADKAPDSAHWIHEIKFDGYRLQARLSDGKVTLLTRRGLDWTLRFPSVAAAIAKLPAKAALIDGELVVEGEDGVSSFSLLQQALKASRASRMVYYLFDLLHLDGDDLRPLPLRTRKAALAKLLTRAPAKGALRLSESIAEHGPLLLKHACRLGLEGIVSKRSDAAYHSGRGHDWIKTKCSDRQEFVIAGFARSSADIHAVGALVLAVYDRGALRYAGRTGSGFTQDSARELYRKLNALRFDKPPFASVPKEERGVRAPVWVSPKLVAEVDFHGWTHGNRVRQASLQGLREDKPAKQVVHEMKAMAAINTNASAKRRSAPVKKAPAAVAGVTLTHLDRIYWADAGISKRDLAEFYQAVWKWMRPHVAGRPIALLRCPEGVGEQCFFQKHASAGIATERLHQVHEKGDKIISIDDLDGLISLVQAGVLEIHTRGTTIDDRERADRLVFDLDPGPGTRWRDVVAAAREVRDRLVRLKLKSFVKTTGGKGLHVVLPIKPTPWDEAKDFAHAVAATMARDAPDRYIATATKAKRSKRIFIDYLRNSREATAVAPYSTRARPGAAVSTPVDWSELSSLKSADQYTVKNLVQRLARLRKDPWANIGRMKQSLPKPK